MKKNSPSKYYIITFGCQMNHSDSQRMAALLAANGLTQAKNEDEADLIIINSCSVRQMAEDRTYGKINKLAKKKNRPRIIATGCLVSDKIKNKLLRQSKFDLCLPIDRMIDLPKYLEKWGLIKVLGSRFQVLGKELMKEGNYRHYLDIIPKFEQNFSAYLPIMTGCNNFCSYCAVPFTRGREVSRPMEDIVNEAKALAKNGCVELILLGQNVNSYMGSLKVESLKLKVGENNKFVELLRKISDIKKLKRIFFISSHPKDMSDELIDLVASRDNLCKYIHLPLQSGDDEILKRMNRHYTQEDYLQLAKNIKDRIPGVVISTDVIVGFPGETDEQFANSCKVFKEVGFDMAYISEYSPRPKTAAAKLDNDVSNKVKSQRKKILNDDYLAKSSLDNKKRLLNKTIPVLVSKINRKGKLVAYTQGLQQVHLEGKKDLIGKIVDAKITEIFIWGMRGTTNF
ncbi:MAG: tRNA (N6-isopentenyl adenosine(37)-C2)-methylthiotransferase MiaB [Patescibacteria group bacterium]